MGDDEPAADPLLLALLGLTLERNSGKVTGSRRNELTAWVVLALAPVNGGLRSDEANTSAAGVDADTIVSSCCFG